MDRWMAKTNRFIESCRARSQSRSRGRRSSSESGTSRSRSYRSHSSRSWSSRSDYSDYSDSTYSSYSSDSRSRSESYMSSKRSRSPTNILRPERSEGLSVDLEEDVVSLSSFIHNPSLLLREAVRTIGGQDLALMIPDQLKDLDLDDLEDECLELLGKLSPDQILEILNPSKSEKAVQNAEASSSEDEVEKEEEDDESSDEKKKHKKKKSKHKHKSKHKKTKKSKKKHKDKKDKDQEKAFIPRSVVNRIVENKSPEDEEMKLKIKKVNSLPDVQINLMDLLELEYRRKAIKAVLLRQGVDANNIDHALDEAIKSGSHDAAGNGQSEKSQVEENGTPKPGCSTWVESRTKAVSTDDIEVNTEDKTATSGLSNQDKREDSIASTVKSPSPNPSHSDSDHSAVETFPVSGKSKQRAYRSKATSDDDAQSASPKSDFGGDSAPDESVNNNIKDKEDALMLTDHSDDDEFVESDSKQNELGDATDSDSEVENVRRRDWRKERVSFQENEQSIVPEDITDMEEIVQSPEPDRNSPVEYLTCYASPAHSFDAVSNVSDTLEDGELIDDDDAGEPTVIGCAEKPEEVAADIDTNNQPEEGADPKNPDIAESDAIAQANVDNVDKNQHFELNGPEGVLSTNSAGTFSTDEEKNLMTANDENPRASASKEAVDRTQITWYKRWFQNSKTQNVVKDTKLQSKVRSKLKADKQQKAASAAAANSPIVPEQPEEPIIGTIEEYQKLFGNRLPPPETNGSESKEIENEGPQESDDDTDLWADIL